MKLTYEEKFEISSRLKSQRKERNMSQDAFAEALDISLSAYKKIESGENGISSSVAKALIGMGISLDYVFGNIKNSFEDIKMKISGLSLKEKEELLLWIAFRDTP